VKFATDIALPPGRGHAYIGGELRVVAAVRQVLADRGLARDQLSAKAYWRRGVANAAHGEPERDAAATTT
jgi:NADPH-dependent ferric siderophore reductase